MGAINTFSNILPILSGVTTTVTALEKTFGALNNAGGNAAERQQELAMQQLRQQQKFQEGQLAQNSALERQRLALQSSQDETERRQSLKRAVSRQRALFGSSGIGSGAGSSEAVLLGLFDESDEEREKREQLDAVRGRALDLNAEQNRSLNLLQATQLAQRQKLARLS